MALTRTKKKTYVFYGLVALLVLLPLLKGGYLLTLDMVFTPELRLPPHVTNSYLLYALLHYADVLLPADVVQKIVLFLVLFLSGLGMHRLAQVASFKDQESSTKKKKAAGTWNLLHVTCYLSGVLYAVNPFTYDRFMAGQYLVLLGYALLPWFVCSLLAFIAHPRLLRALRVALWAVLVSIVSIHSVGLLVLVTTVMLLAHAWRCRARLGALAPVLQYGGLALGLFVAASCYWLVPLLMGRGHTATTIASFGMGDQQAFATVGDGVIGQLANVLRLQGFWAEAHNLFLLPQDVVAAWGLVVLALWAFVIVGMVHWWRQGRRFELAVFGLLIVGSAMLATGVLHGWLATSLPLFGGYREPQKFVALVALSYAVFAGVGLRALLERYAKSLVKTWLLVGLAVLLLFYFARPMWWGFDGQLTPRHYPADWFTLNERLNKDPSDFRVLFLPWHLYMHYGFAGRIIAHPAPKFFDKPVLVNTDPELFGASASSTSEVQDALDRILPAASQGNQLGAQLAPLRIKYVVVAKDFDHKRYTYIDKQADLRLIMERDTLSVYMNTAYKEPK